MRKQEKQEETRITSEEKHILCKANSKEKKRSRQCEQEIKMMEDKERKSTKKKKVEKES